MATTTNMINIPAEEEKSSLPPVIKKVYGNKKPTKTGIVPSKPERIIWMSRTSDVLGAHVKTDLDSYLTLVRRKVQEKFSSKQDLINHIRRIRMTDKIHVTPSEFRFTLVKFGITLPQSLTDKIFAVFDTTRSGWVDFDEFAMWIMNSEFRPVQGKRIDKVTADEPIESKIRNILLGRPNVFKLNAKKKVTFMEFLTEIQVANSEISDADIRQLYIPFDPNGIGFIDLDRILAWIKTGVIHSKAVSSRLVNAQNNQLPSLIQSVAKISGGRSTKHIETCFSHIPGGRGIMLSLDEFRSCLLAGGMGQNEEDVQQLFKIINGTDDPHINIDKLRKKFAPMPYDLEDEVSAKKQIPSAVRTSRADRHLRESIRKCFDIIKSEFEAIDTEGTGVIAIEDLRKVLMRRCIPLSYQDFRLILIQLKTEEGETKVNWHHFLRVYNPASAPHILEAIAPNNLNESLTLLPSLKSSQEFSILSSKQDILSQPRAQTASAALSQSAGIDLKYELRRLWQIVVKECQKLDIDRSGSIPLETFVTTVENATIGKNLSSDAIKSMALEYTNSVGHIDYMGCVKRYMYGDAAPKKPLKSMKPEPFEKTLRPLHPWEFDYQKGRDKLQPYWSSATNLPREVHADHNTLSMTHKAQSTGLSTTEKEALLNMYSANVLHICRKCYIAFITVWRELRNELKRNQISSAKGCIDGTLFADILIHFNAKLSNIELGALIRSFRGQVENSIKFDEFLRVCLVVKNLNPEDWN